MQTDAGPATEPDEPTLTVVTSRLVVGLIADRNPERGLRRALPVLSAALEGRPCGYYEQAVGGGLRLTAGIGELPSDIDGDALPREGTAVPVEGDDLGILLVGGEALLAGQRAMVEAVAAVLGATIARADSDGALRDSQAMEALGRLTLRMSEELTQATRQVVADADDLVRGDGADRSGIDLIRRHGRQAAAMAAQLQTFAASAHAGATGTDLARVVHDTAGLVTGLLPAGATLEIAADEPRLATVSRHVAEQVVVRLVALLLAAGTPGRTVVRLRLDDVDGDAVPASRANPSRTARYVRLSAVAEPSEPGSDEGANAGARSALGWTAERCRVSLANLVEPRGGWLAVDLEQTDQRSAAVHLPCGTAASASQPAPSPSSPGLPVVLLAEDQATVRSLLRGILTQRGYRVIEAVDGMEALRLLGAAGSIDLLATDIVMPNLGGRQLAAHARAIHPDLPIIFFTGYAECADPLPLLPRSLTLTKPFGMGDFVRCVDEMLASGYSPARRRAS